MNDVTALMLATHRRQFRISLRDSRRSGYGNIAVVRIVLGCGKALIANKKEPKRAFVRDTATAISAVSLRGDSCGPLLEQVAPTR